MSNNSGRQKEEEKCSTTKLQGSRDRIMIIDDEADITSSLKIQLEDYGFIVDRYNDPIEVLSTFKPGSYDLLLIDVRMPKMNGFELYQEIKKKDDKIKVCFITGYEVFYESLKSEFPNLNVGCFIKKPVTEGYLVKRVKAELDLVSLG